MKLKKEDAKTCLKSNWLTVATFTGVILGLVIGIVIKQSDPEKWNHPDCSKREAMYVGFIGRLFLSALKSIIIPLIVPSLIIAVGTLDLSLSGKIGGRAIAYYMTTTLIAIVIGIILVMSIQPGNGVAGNDSVEKKERHITTADTLMDLVRNLIPPNILQATMQQQKTELTKPTQKMIELDMNKNVSCLNVTDKTTWQFETNFKDNSNILGLVMWSIVFGIAIAAVGDRAKPVLDFFIAFTEIMMMITQFVINFAPLGVCFLVAEQVLNMKSFEETFKGLGAYFGTVVLGLLIHGLIILPILYGLITRSLPFKYLSNMGNG